MKTSLFLACAAVVALSACGQAQPSGAGANATPTIAPAPATTSQGDGQPLPPAQVDAKALSDLYQDRRVWVSPDGKRLRLNGMAHDACTGVEGKVVEESATTVRIALLPMAMPQGGPEGGQMCAMVVTSRPVTVALHEPLGQRTVVVTEG